MIHHFIVITPSLVLATRLQRMGHAVYLVVGVDSRPNNTAADPKQALDYGTVMYQQQILQRTVMVHRALLMGSNVLIADIDAVWLSDPFIELHKHHHSHDVLAPVDGYNDQWICGCLVYLRNSQRTVRAWEQVVTHHQGIVLRGMQTGSLSHRDESEQEFISAYFKRPGK